MPTVIGTIKVMMGQAWIEAADGSRRQAMEGEQVMRGEQVVTEQGAVTVTLPDGKSLDLGRMSQWGGSGAATATADATATQDVAAVQQAITEGADPTQILEATAAGNPIITDAQGEAGEGGRHSFVMLELTGQILDPNAGYPTDGLGSGRPDRVEEDTSLFGTNAVDLNNPAIIGGDDTGSVVEDDSDPTLADSGRLSIHDPDEAQSWFIPNSVKASDGALGHLILARDGSWRYEVNNADVQYLAEGETKIETFVVKSADGTEHTVTITITGRNDAPELSATGGEVLQEDNGIVTGTAPTPDTLATGGTLSMSDVDTADTHSYTSGLTSVTAGENTELTETQLELLSQGTFTVSDDGKSWSYEISNDLTQSLAEGQEAKITYWVTVKDSHGATDTQPVTITIKGTNDAPVLSASGGEVLQEDNGIVTGTAPTPDTLATSGALSMSDVDTADTHSYTSGLTSVTAGENTELTETQLELLSQGTFTVSEDGKTWSYEIDNALTQTLAEGQEAKITYWVTVKDSHGATDTQPVTITIKGTNDAPVLSASGGEVLQEDNGIVTGTAPTPDTLATSGALSMSDVDTADTHSYTSGFESVTAGESTELTEAQLELLSQGTFTVSEDGKTWSYEIDNALTQTLAEGQEAKITYWVTVKDSHGATDTQPVTITIKGTNDAPVLSASGGEVLQEDNGIVTGTAPTPDTLATGGTLSMSDVDTADTHSYTSGLTSVTAGESTELTEAQLELLSKGTFTVSEDGKTWSYEIDNALTQTLAEGQEAKITYWVTVKDSHGATDTQPVTITIKGTNDTPTIEVTSSEELSESHIPDGATGTFTVDDIDTSNALSVSLGGPSESLTSGGAKVEWAWDAEVNKLVGYTGSTEDGTYKSIVEVQLTPPEGTDRGEWSFKVELKGPIDHPEQGTDDVKFDLAITVDDGKATSTGSLEITIVDDVPVLSAPSVGQVSSEGIPDVLLGKFDLGGDATSETSLRYTDAQGHGFTVTANGFTSKTDSTLTEAEVDRTGSGLGVKSQEGPYHNIANEIDYRVFDGENGASEELIFTLDVGSVAYGVTIEFEKMYGGELESGIVEFYRDGKLIATQEFSSDDKSGNYAKNFSVQEGGFDKMIVKATDNFERSKADNSDFTVKGVTFIGPNTDTPIGYAEGTLDIDWGADGKYSLALDKGGVEGELRTSAGLEITTTFSESGNTALGYDSNGNLVFRLEFTPETGKWEFYQYQDMQQPGVGDDKQIDFGFKATDGDGDVTDGIFSVIPRQTAESGSSGNEGAGESGDGPDTPIIPGGNESTTVGSYTTADENEPTSVPGKTIDGTDQDDILIGTDGDDIIYGGDGNDVLIGGKGDDILWGGGGNDTFKWEQGDYGNDIIKDFSVENDKIDLTDLLKGLEGKFSDYVDIAVNGNDTVITVNTQGLSAGGNETLVQITVEDCTSTNIDSLIAKPDTLV
ncbi:retention module-containing protein [Kluyvera ascorbata]|uniref:retention module-containing protein n=1 Tax=Kluyvera ascorbata TaxID=51288 RepID=UPI0022DEA6C1|nr:retention module-containing protein [Kluyvera ascorbata]